jgi:hypothetical protein
MSWPPTIGETLPRARDAYGVLDKLLAYSLSPEHDVGSHKARVFRQMLAITTEDADYLTDQLLAGIRKAPVSDVRDIVPHGVLCGVLVPVHGLRARMKHVVVVTTSWQIRFEKDAPRLVTAYIER